MQTGMDEQKIQQSTTSLGSVDPAIVLPDELPEAYPPNLCALPVKQQQAIQEDKIRWVIAVTQIRDSKPGHIRQWLEALEPMHLQEDMRSRLNRLREQKNNGRAA